MVYICIIRYNYMYMYVFFRQLFLYFLNLFKII